MTLGAHAPRVLRFWEKVVPAILAVALLAFTTGEILQVPNEYPNESPS